MTTSTTHAASHCLPSSQGPRGNAPLYVQVLSLSLGTLNSRPHCHCSFHSIPGGRQAAYYRYGMGLLAVGMSTLQPHYPDSLHCLAILNSHLWDGLYQNLILAGKALYCTAEGEGALPCMIPGLSWHSGQNFSHLVMTEPPCSVITRLDHYPNSNTIAAFCCHNAKG